MIGVIAAQGCRAPPCAKSLRASPAAADVMPERMMLAAEMSASTRIRLCSRAAGAVPTDLPLRRRAAQLHMPLEDKSFASR